MLTPSYFKSNFCLCELGAAWAMFHKIFPILVPPLGFNDVKDALTGVQALKVDDDISYNELRDYLYTELNIKIKSSTKWDVKRKKFLKKLNKIIKNIVIPNEVSFEEFQDIKNKYDESLEEFDNYESEIDELKKYIEELENCKDAGEVKLIKSKNKKAASLMEEFDEIIENISSFGENVSTEVFKFILSEHYGKPYKIDFYSDQEEFMAAARYNYISTDDEVSVNWQNRKLSDLHSHLGDLSTFLEEYDEEKETEMSVFFEMYDDKYQSPLEPNNQEFWEEHYSI